MTETPFYHAGMRELQDRFDGRRLADVLATRVRHDSLGPEDAAVVEAAAFFMIATCHADRPDCGMRSGDPGFARVTAAGEIEFPDYDGNSIYRTLGNLALNPEVGLLFVAFDGRSNRLRVNGRASLHDDAATLARHPGARLVVRVVPRDVFPNCPRYVPDVASGRPSPDVPRGAPTPVPDWKRIPLLTPALPADDPHAPRLGEGA